MYDQGMNLMYRPYSFSAKHVEIDEIEKWQSVILTKDGPYLVIMGHNLDGYTTITYEFESLEITDPLPDDEYFIYFKRLHEFVDLNDIARNIRYSK